MVDSVGPGIKKKGELNDAQKQAVNVRNSSLLITAPPGSGKTTVLKERAVALLKDYPNDKLAAVTFTADAAAELKHRILAKNPELCERLIAGTFHALCKKQLEESGERFILINDAKQKELLYKAYHLESNPSLKISYETAGFHVAAIKSRIEPIISKDPVSQNCYDIYLRYEKLLAQMGVMDFSDLLIKSVKGMINGSVMPLPVSHILADEFQDTDDVQYRWIKEHYRRGAEITCVGDDDQSIYAWRNAMGYEGMETFRQDCHAMHISLNVSYRCAREIIAPATTLVSNIHARVQKDIKTDNLGLGRVVFKQCVDLQDEANKLCNEINKSGNRKSWGILARNNSYLENIEPYIEGNGIKCSRPGKKKFSEYQAPSLFLDVCKSISEGNMIGFDSLLRKSGVAESSLNALHNRINSKEGGALRRFVDTQSKSKDLVSNLSRCAKSWVDEAERGQVGMTLLSLSLFIEKNVLFFGQEKVGKISEFDKKMLKSCVDTLNTVRGPLENRMMNMQKKEEENEADDNTVRLMTLHSSKGLEFDNVWILGCSKGIIPSKYSVNIDEERRLLYVGMTRAKFNLFLSRSMSNDSDCSPFIDEAGIKVSAI